MRNLLFWISVFLCLIHSGITYSQVPARDNNLTYIFYKANQLGMGGAWRSLAWGVNSLTVNPAGMSIQKATGLGFDYHTSGFWGGTLLAGAVYDSKSTLAGMGLGYDKTELSFEGRSVSVNQLTMAFSKDFSDVVFVGSNLKYYHISREPLAGGTLNHFSGDLGVIVKPVDELYLAAVLQNMYSGRTRAEIPLLLGFGAGLSLWDMAKLSVDIETDFSTRNSSNTNLYFGGEFLVTKGIFCRGGYGLDRIRDNPFFAIGIALLGPRLSIDFTFAERVNPVDQIYALTVQVLI